MLQVCCRLFMPGLFSCLASAWYGINNPPFLAFCADCYSLRSTRRSSSSPLTLASRRTSYPRYSSFIRLICQTGNVASYDFIIPLVQLWSLYVFLSSTSISMDIFTILVTGGEHEWPWGSAALSPGGLFARAPSCHCRGSLPQQHRSQVLCFFLIFFAAQIFYLTPMTSWTLKMDRSFIHKPSHFARLTRTFYFFAVWCTQNTGPKSLCTTPCSSCAASSMPTCRTLCRRAYWPSQWRRWIG